MFERNDNVGSAIWVMPIAGGEAIRFTGGATNAHKPRLVAGWTLVSICFRPRGRIAGEHARRAEKARQGKSANMAHPNRGRRSTTAYVYAAWCNTARLVAEQSASAIAAKYTGDAVIMAPQLVIAAGQMFRLAVIDEAAQKQVEMAVVIVIEPDRAGGPAGVYQSRLFW